VERPLARRIRRPLPPRLALGAVLVLTLALGGLLWREHAAHVHASTELAAARGTLAAERGALASERARHERELEDLRSERELPVACAALDRILQHLEEGDPAGAEAALASARVLPGLDALGFDSGYLDGLLALRASLEDARASADVLARARLLLEARAQLAAAERAGERFRLEGARWLALDLAPRPARAADCERWHDNLAHELARLSASIRAGLEERWSALEASAKDDPAEVVLLARWFGDARVQQYLARLPRDATALRAALAPWREGAEREGAESEGTEHAPSQRERSGAEGLLPDRQP